MNKASKPIGLNYRKLDLHIHTPASKCFNDKSVSPDQFVKEALQKGLEGVAITDHNSGDWIDKVKEAAKKKIVVFPGVEISCTGGKGGIHIIAILPPSKGTKDIENLLGGLNLKADIYGKKEALSTKSPSEVIDVIAEHGGLPILAHANAKNGVEGGMKGNQRLKAVNHPAECVKQNETRLS